MRSELGTRPYTLRKRAEKARATRDLILRSARHLAARDGFGRLTVEGVAADAGVSRVSVYNHFESKAGLLEALAWSIFAHADISRVRAARMDPDPGTALRGFVAANAEFLAAVGDQGRAVLAAAMSDPDLREVVDATYIAARRTAVTEVIERLEAAGTLPARLSRERAVASLMILTSLEALETLTVHSGLDTAQAGELLAGMASAVLVAGADTASP